ncbi:MAG: amidohydrolase [Firmicutes bacterium]|nr:amidohydrolase [Bacillota bacterium]
MNEGIREWFEEYSQAVVDLTYDLWSHPELSYQEYRSCQSVADFMRKQGFQVKTVAAEAFCDEKATPNTVIATWGSGRPVIGILGEMDGLPGLGQEAVPYPSPIEGPGHGCGHNLMGGGCVAAASALKRAMEKEGLSGTIKLVDCPAEEVGSGKVDLARNGVFSDMDVCLSYHPDNSPFILDAWECMAVMHLVVEFHGVGAHAAMMPWKGRSALDAAELMNIGVQYLREHVTSDCSLHYVYRDGGMAPNIVPEHAALDYYVRAADENLDDLLRRVLLVANGAAMMTETKVEWHMESATCGFIPNIALNYVVYEAAKKIPPLEYSQEDYDFARSMYCRATGEIPPEEPEQVLATRLKPPCDTVEFTSGSTDIADVSHIVPITHMTGSGRVMGLPSHHWTVTAAAGMGIGQKAMLYSYKVLAQAGYDLIQNPEAVEQVRREFTEKNKKPYTSRMDRDYIGL